MDKAKTREAGFAYGSYDSKGAGVVVKECYLEDNVPAGEAALRARTFTARASGTLSVVCMDGPPPSCTVVVAAPKNR